MNKLLSSLYFKNFITIVVLLCITVLILGLAFAGLSYRYIIRDKIDTMQQNADTAGRMVAAYSQEWRTNGLEVRTFLVWMESTTGFGIVITNAEGQVINCSDREINCPHIGRTVPAWIVNAINNQQKYSGVSTLGDVYQDDRYVVGTSLPAVGRDGEKAGYIFLSGETGKMIAVWRSFAGIFLMSTIVVVVIAFVLSFITTGKQTRPIKEMADAARRFGEGDLSVRVAHTQRSDEIGELTEAFNSMADSLERSEKSRRELIANVSHELKTPMTTITGFADGILDGTIPQEKAPEYLQIISSETKRLSRLVRGMLDMSQLQNMDTEEMKKKSFDILEVICQALLSLEKKITDRGLDVDAQLPEEAIMTVGDRDAITQVVYNLIDNAAKFANAGSAIGIKLWKEGDLAYVSVENEGEAISKEELPLIFDRFHKTDRSRSQDREGVGLGLYIVKTILDAHGDDIYVTSRDGVTKFVFTLKLSKN